MSVRRFWLKTVLAAILLAGTVFTLALLLSSQPDLLGGATFSRVFTDRNGQLLRVTLTPDEKYRIYTPLEQIPAEMQDAVLLYEDRSFWRHFGVSFPALARAAWNMARGGRRMGGSTITMQLVRLSGNLATTSLSGKLRQIWCALVLERHYSKPEILEAYLNLAPYGGNVEGVGAAARIWFGKDVSQLALPEILALVPVPQHPAARNPLAVQGRDLSRARLRLNALWETKYPDPNMELFARMPLRVLGPAFLPQEAPHAINSLLSEINPSERDTLVTTLDLPIQRLLEQILAQAVARGAIWGMNNAAALLLDWRSGEIRALVGSANFFAASIQGQVDGTAARRSPGSTLKPFLYALAVAQGLIHPQTLLADTPRVFRGYEPENADGEFQGPISARRALQSSRNIPAIALADRLFSPTLYDFLQNAGVRFAESSSHYGLALVLGGAEVTMREIAGLYALL